MYIERHAIARLLETKPSNIKKTRQIEETIQARLWDAKDPVVIPVQKYNDFLEEQRKQHSKLSTGGTKGIGITLMGIGALVTISGCTMDTTISTGFGQRVHNIGLVNEQNQQTQLGGIAFIAGVVLYCLDKKNSNL